MSQILQVDNFLLMPIVNREGYISATVFNCCTIIAIYQTVLSYCIHLGMTVDLCMTLYAHARFDGFDLDAS